MYIGRIIGNNVTELRFRTNYNQEINIGEILIIEDNYRKRQFLIRIVNIEYGQEAGEEWMERTAGNMMLMEEENQKYDIHDKKRRLYKIGICAPLGKIEDNIFKKAKSIPPHFSKVRKAKKEDYNFLKEVIGDIEVGKLRSGEDLIDIGVGIIGKKAYPHHIGIFATTGMGKSNLMKVIGASTMEIGKYGLLILDPHGEYFDGGEAGKKGLKHYYLADKMLDIYSARELLGNYNKIKISAHEIEINDLMNLYDFTGPQKEALISSYFKFGKSWIVDLYEKDVSEIISDLEHFQEGTIRVIKRKLNNLFRYGLITRDENLSITNNIISALRLGKVVLVDTSNMYESEELLVSIVLARAIFEVNKKLYGEQEKFEKIPPVLITIEEAQRVLGKGMRMNIFAKIAREGRKFKTGVCAISQQPKLIDNEVISQFNTFFILGLADKKDRDILRDSAKQDVSQLDNEIQMLMAGEALITSPYTPFAIPVKIHLYEEYVDENRQDSQFFDKKNVIRVDDGFF